MGMRPDSGAMPKWSCKLALGLPEEHGKGCTQGTVSGPHRRGAPWPGGWSVQGAEPEDGQEGVDRNTHPGGHALLVTFAWGSPLNCCPPSPISLTSELWSEGPPDNVVGVDFGKAYFWQNQQTG